MTESEGPWRCLKSVLFSDSPCPWLRMDTHKHTNTRLCAHALAPADLQLLPSTCPAAVAVSWEGVDGVAVWMPKAKSADPCHPNSIPPCPPPRFPLPSLPPGPGANTASNLLPTQEGQGPVGPCALLGVGHLPVACLFSFLFFESVNRRWGGNRGQTVTADSKKFIGEGVFLES